MNNPDVPDNEVEKRVKRLRLFQLLCGVGMLCAIAGMVTSAQTGAPRYLDTLTSVGLLGFGINLFQKKIRQLHTEGISALKEPEEQKVLRESRAKKRIRLIQCVVVVTMIGMTILQWFTMPALHAITPLINGAVLLLVLLLMEFVYRKTRSMPPV